MFGKLVTHDVLKLRGWEMPSRYSFYKKNEEMVNHLFVNCVLFNWLWKVLLLKLGKLYHEMDNVQQPVGFFVKEFEGNGLCPIIATNAFCMSIYHLWGTRDDIVFDDAKITRMSILNRIEQELKWKLKGRDLKMLTPIELEELPTFGINIHE